MIEQLSITNFQAHQSLTVDFDPQITTIIGPSDVGKSAILRALRWACLNVPGGEGFIREGSRDAVVELTIDGKKIKRQRGKAGNLYYLDGSEFKAFGSTPPKDIESVANVSAINFQGQHDTVFWFGESAGEVSRQLNAVVDLGVIDESLSTIAGKLDHFRSAAKISKERLTKAKAKKAELEWVVAADAEWSEVENQLISLTKIKADTRRLQAMLTNIADSTTTRDNARQQAIEVREIGLAGNASRKVATKRQALLDLLDKIKEKKAKAEAEVPDVTDMLEVVNKWIAVKQKLNKLRRAIVAIETATETASKKMPSIVELDETISSYKTLKKKISRLRKAIDSVADAESKVAETKRAYQQAEKQFADETAGVCPICGGGLP